MSPELRKRFFIILAVIAGCFVSLIPINKRINLGLDLKGGMHLILRVQNDNQILLQLPGVTDRDKALDMIGRVARLEFHLVDADDSKLKDAMSGHVPDGEELMIMKKDS